MMISNFPVCQMLLPGTATHGMTQESVIVSCDCVIAALLSWSWQEASEASLLVSSGEPSAALVNLLS